MTWFKLDDGFHSHPKVMALFAGPCPGDAIALFTLAGSWCSRELTDGVVPLGFVRRSGLHQEAAAELVRVGLWEARGDGSHVVHDYLKYNPDREAVLRDRTAGALRKTAHRKRLDRGTPKASPEASGMPHPGLAAASPSPDPDPDPVSTETKSYLSAADASHAHAREDFGGGRVLREFLPRGPSAAAQGAAWLARATGQEVFSHSGRWMRPLEELARKPEREREAAAGVLTVEARKPDVLPILNPQHIADHWHLYGKGRAPGKAAANGGRRRTGPSRVPTAEEYARDAEEPAPWET